MDKPKNVFVVGMTDFQHRELQTIAGAEHFRFHSLLDYEAAVCSHDSFDALLERARRQLQAFDGTVDAIVSHWDFPTSCLVPMLRREWGMPAPSLESVLKCEHKYWARLEQRKVVPECVPPFQAIDPFDPAAADQLELDYPFWLKPIKAFSSQLGFRIDNREEFEAALEKMREGIAELGNPFDECLAHAELPPEVAGIGGRWCIAEGLISGRQAAPEGYVQNGEVHIHGLLDMVRDKNGKSFSHMLYPSRLPESVQHRMCAVARKVLGGVGFDNGCFNVEYLWDEASDRLWLVEVNTRISQSHSELFIQVDGRSNHEIAVSIALGREPRFPREKGPFEYAAKFWINKEGDARVERVPDPRDIEAVRREVPGAAILVDVAPGTRLSELPNQDVYRFVLGEAYIGGRSPDEVVDNYRRALDHLPFKFSDGGRPHAP